MPELPEVQTTVDGLNRLVRNKTIVKLWNGYKSGFHFGKDNVKDPAFFEKFKKIVEGKKILKAERRGKNILIFVSGEQVILIHMKMTGHLLYGKYNQAKDTWLPEDPKSALADSINRHVRFVFLLDNNNHLVLSDMRRFAKITLFPTVELKQTLHLKDLGPDPLEKDFSSKDLFERLHLRKNGFIKSVLLDPKVISGVGNIYSDEALFRASIHPERKVSSLSKKEIELLHKALREVLKKGIDLGGDSMSDYRNIEGKSGGFQAKHEAYRRTGSLCTKKGCEGKITRKKVGGRSAHFCNIHQK